MTLFYWYLFIESCLFCYYLVVLTVVSNMDLGPGLLTSWLVVPVVFVALALMSQPRAV